MRSIAIACLALLVGIGIGLYEARAASTIKYDYYLLGKDVPNLTGMYQCLQKIPNAGETVAFAKEYWAKNPSMVAANAIFINACLYKPGSAKTNTMTGGGGKGRSQGGRNAAK